MPFIVIPGFVLSFLSNLFISNGYSICGKSDFKFMVPNLLNFIK